MVKTSDRGIYFNGTNREFKQFLSRTLCVDITVKALLALSRSRPAAAAKNTGRGAGIQKYST